MDSQSEKSFRLHRLRGKKKGQFAKKSIIDGRENNLKAIEKSRKRKKENPEVPSIRRIVDLNTFCEQMKCKSCNIFMDFNNRIEEKVCGIVYIFKIKCLNCQIMNQVCTNKPSAENCRKYPVNNKIALGMIDAGIGESQLNVLLNSINVPPIRAATLKKYERDVGKVIENVAIESCLEAIQIEKELCSKELETNDVQEVEEAQEQIHNETPSSLNPFFNCNRNEINKYPIKASFDCAWQKRGTGHAYNSLSGHSTLIGYNSGKIISYAARTVDCRFCKNGVSQDKHDCRVNFKGTAKAMEPDMAVEMINKNPLLDKENVQISTLIGDEDSCAIAAVRRTASKKIEKWSDFNHSLKALTSALYTLKLAPKLIEYFSRSFSQAVKQNKGKAYEVKAALMSIVPHAFGNHDTCGNWCNFKELGENYSYKYFRNGKALQDPDLQTSLIKIFTRFANNAEKICHCGSTQSNESVNNIIASKNPKYKHYGSSDSLFFRVAAGVSQKNIGYEYTKKVMEKLQQSPISKRNEHFFKKKEEKKNLRFIRDKSIFLKKRRAELKKNRFSKTAAISRKEGITYESGINLSDVSALVNNSYNNEIENQEIFDNCKVVLFDLETTGLSKNDEIVQIAAQSFDSNEQFSSFNVYILPSKDFSKRATEVTGLQMIDSDLYYNDEKLNALPVRAAFTEFIKFLQSFKNPTILLAHNGFRFNTPRILKLVLSLGLSEEFGKVVKGFADSLIILRKTLPERVNEKKKFSIQALANDYFTNFNLKSLHNAINDINILAKILLKSNIDEKCIKSFTKSLYQIHKEEKIKIDEGIHKLSLQNYNGNISKNIINKIAKAGLNHTIMQDTYQKNGVDGLRILLSESVDGKPRVTSNKKILNSIYAIFSNINEMS